MTPRRIPLIAALLAALAPAAACADNRHDAPSVEEDRPLSFGAIAASATAGTITVSPAGPTSCKGVRCLGGAAPALFSVTGAKDELVAISVSPVKLTNNKGATLTAVLVPSISSMVLRPGKSKNPFSVGGTLTVGANQPAGAYRGDYLVTIEYQ